MRLLPVSALLAVAMWEEDTATPHFATARLIAASQLDAAGRVWCKQPVSQPATLASPTARRALDAYDAYLFDVDGTLLYVDRPVPGATETLAALQARRTPVLAVTNNSSYRRHEVAARFREHGLPLADQEVFSALVATARYVAHQAPGARVYVFGNPGLRGEAEAIGLRVVDDASADYVLVGTVKDISYDKLTIAMRALLNGARFVAVNADRNYVGADGQLVPGAGAFVGALERCTGRAPDAIVGKPSATILREAADSLDLGPRAVCLYVGDNAEVDVAGAHAAGMDALLVLSGVASQPAPGRQPDWVLPSVADLGRLVGAAC